MVHQVVFTIGAATPSVGNINATYLLGNIWIDLATQSPFTPYVGGGLGVGWIDGDVSNGGATLFLTENSGSLAFQIGAGVKYSISQNFYLDIGYRFKEITDVNFNGTFVGPLKSDNISSHNVQAGITFHF